MIREPCVSGLFYESDKDLLIGQIKKYFEKTDNKDDAHLDNVVSCVVPHAGYVYSGLTASYTFSELCCHDLPDTFIILGPNHTGFGTNIDVCTYSGWKTPLGVVDVDTEFVEELLNVDDNVVVDNAAHMREHSIEVELPFIQYICGSHSFRIVPIVISRQVPELCENLARSLDKVMSKLGRKCVVVASTDLTHYEDVDTALFLDAKVMKSVESMCMDDMVNDIVDYDITMCGYGPVITAVTLAKLQDYDRSIVLNHSTSGDVSGDYDSVVGYMSAVIGK
ncbi:MAG: AmmeMemoRadiSam system protein B [Methanosphaera sp.]|nr:AmmeMemoRadiSam system protein B [Methanosphaera sp.]